MNDLTESTQDFFLEWIGRDAAKIENTVPSLGPFFALPAAKEIVDLGTKDQTWAPPFAMELDKEHSFFGSPMTAPPARVHARRTHRGQDFGLVRKYEGVVTKVNEQTFWAYVHENINDFPAVEAEFEITALPPSDRSILKENMPVVWTVGVELEDGTYRQQSIVYLRRLPAPLPEQIKQSEFLIDSRMKSITWE